MDKGNSLASQQGRFGRRNRSFLSMSLEVARAAIVAVPWCTASCEMFSFSPYHPRVVFALLILFCFVLRLFSFAFGYGFAFSLPQKKLTCSVADFDNMRPQVLNCFEALTLLQE
ncbi:hypothetical protein AVEN_215844-1 [Araneus ventricosus]|uniref:Transmembrane protein n=1 Tax=Araneus ventricosus TaxID=182803 RepID=A0A4Y2PYJ0_ARAVE|nr:hypothetical protein AVEN_215844-1 [Araneus ventricosus]